MSNTDVRVIATDGDQVKEVLYINHQDTSIVYNVRDAFGSGKEHITYHEDGYVHHKRVSPDGDISRVPMVQGPPIDEFSGFFGAHTFMIPKRPESDDPRFSWGSTKPSFSFSQKDAIVYIDVRNAEKQINVHPYFLEVGKPFTDVINHPGSEAENPYLQYQVITETDPWTAIAYYPIGEWSGFLQPHSRDFVVVNKDREPHSEDKHGQEQLKLYREN